VCLISSFNTFKIVLGVSWVNSMSLSTKYLILAAYLASCNPKESDKDIFTGSQKGKRKKSKNRTQNGTSASSSSSSSRNGATASNSEMGAVAGLGVTISPRVFDLERLLGLFILVVAHIEGNSAAPSGSSGGRGEASSSRGTQGTQPGLFHSNHQAHAKISKTYGDSELFACVASLVKQRILVRGSNSSVWNPSFQSTVTSEMAEAIAKVLSFPLEDLLFAHAPN
jgi:hypothetical protein